MRVVVVEDHPLMRRAVESSLEREGIEIVASVTTAQDGYREVAAQQAEVVVVDIGLPDESGIDLTRRLLQRDGNLAVVIHTGVADPVALKDALDCGARGFAYKTGGPDALVTAVRAAAAGGAYVAPELRQAIAEIGGGGPERVLSDRERQIFALLADGRSNEDIAENLFLSVETVRTHIRNGMRKLGAHTRAHAVVVALRNEEISL